jgi:hypothetical protein
MLLAGPFRTCVRSEHGFIICICDWPLPGRAPMAANRALMFAAVLAPSSESEVTFRNPSMPGGQGLNFLKASAARRRFRHTRPAKPQPEARGDGPTQRTSGVERAAKAKPQVSDRRPRLQ